MRRTVRHSPEPHTPILALAGGARACPSDPPAGPRRRAPESADGTVKYVDGLSSGTTISGVLRVHSSSREQTEQALNRIHEALVRTYIEQPDVRRSFVRMTVSPSDAAQATVESADVAPSEHGATPTTDDIIAQFGLE